MRVLGFFDSFTIKDTDQEVEIIDTTLSTLHNNPKKSTVSSCKYLKLISSFQIPPHVVPIQVIIDTQVELSYTTPSKIDFNITDISQILF